MQQLKKLISFTSVHFRPLNDTLHTLTPSHSTHPHTLTLYSPSIVHTIVSLLFPPPPHLGDDTAAARAADDQREYENHTPSSEDPTQQPTIGWVIEEGH